jgi:Regulator of ribonuclease activity B/Family of unknown function (DUF695)
MGLFGRLMGRRTPDWDEAWQVYPGVVDAAPAVWAVDLGAVAVAPLSHLPVRLDATVPIAAGPDGLPADGAQVAEFEDAVRAAVEALGGAYVGRVSTAATCRFTAHVPSEPAGPVPIATANPATVTTEYDPHWAYVRDTLAPDERQHRLIADLAVVGLLAGHGDPLAVPRDVEHVAFFLAQQPAEEAAADLRADGFAASVERDDEGDFALTALRTDPVAPPVVHDLSWAVMQTVQRHGGTYDGWHCGIAA